MHLLMLRTPLIRLPNFGNQCILSLKVFKDNNVLNTAIVA